jgi:hypothetical protein
VSPPIYSLAQSGNLGSSLSRLIKVQLCARICRDLDPAYPVNPTRDAYRADARDRYDRLLSAVTESAQVLGVASEGRIRLLLEIGGDWHLATAKLDPFTLVLTVESVDGSRERE